MSTLKAYTAKLLMLTLLAGSFCLGMLFHLPMVQAATPYLPEMMAVDHNETQLDIDAMPADCCTITHDEHKTAAITPAVSQIPFPEFTVALPTFVLYEKSLVETFALPANEHRGREFLLIGSVIKRE